MVSEEMGLLGEGPELEKVETLVELLFEVGVHWDSHENADGVHEG